MPSKRCCRADRPTNRHPRCRRCPPSPTLPPPRRPPFPSPPAPATGRERQALQLPNALRAVSLALSADGKRLAVADASTHVTIWERSGKHFLDSVSPKRPGMRLMTVALSPDGSALAVGAETGQV